MLAGLLSPEGGSITVYGKPLLPKSTRSVGYMLQKDQLFEWRTIEKNIFLGLEIQKKLVFHHVISRDDLYLCSAIGAIQIS